MTTGPGGVLLASGLGEDGSGGLFALHAGGVECIDGVPTTGLTVSDDGAQLARVLWRHQLPTASSELILYHVGKARRLGPFKELQEPHGALWHEGRIVVASTMRNQIVWIDVVDGVVDTWTAPGAGDCWHINCLGRDGPRLVASAFGRFSEHRGWDDRTVRRGAGVVFDVLGGSDVLSRLDCPHDPIKDHRGWWVCNSGASELLRLNVRGRVQGRYRVDGWPRGLLAAPDRVVLGVSEHRFASSGSGAASILELDPATLALRRRWTLPTPEVFAIAAVPSALYETVKSTADEVAAGAALLAA